ncbi:MAG: hypothetical protein DRI23_08130 [Candidatus Cloacimonadota bacterium]|nr:MAG: hypothetical protein DRI23_08130 [Candidatus Cloacimonadota bacterium]
MKKLSKEKLELLKKEGRIIKKTILKPKKPKAKIKSVESSLEELTGYVKTIVTKNDNIEIVIEAASKISQVLNKTVKHIESIKPPGQVLEWDITVERDKDDFIDYMNLKAVN